MCFQHADEAIDLAWPRTSAWIVGREMLLYLYLDLTSIPKAQRKKVIQRKAEQASPFAHTGHYHHDEDGSVMLWLWDEALRERAIAEVLEDYSALREHILSIEPIPETVLRSRGCSGNATQACFAGEDLQQWLNGILVSSEWKSTSLDEQPGFIDEPWLEKQVGLLTASEPLLWRFGALLLFLVLAFQSGSLFGNYYLAESLEKQLADSREDVAAMAQSRGNVRKIKQQNAQLLRWTDAASQLAILAEFDRLVPPTADFKEWDFENERLRVVIEDRELNNRVYLESLVTSDLFADVQIAPGSKPRTATITLEVDFP